MLPTKHRLKQPCDDFLQPDYLLSAGDWDWGLDSVISLVVPRKNSSSESNRNYHI